METTTPANRPRVIFINSHPIQYFVPLYQHLQHLGIDTQCWYASDETLRGHHDRQFGVHVAWDIPMLDGYTATFFKNRSWRPSLYQGLFGLINPGMWRQLFHEKKSIVVVHGWNYLTHIGVIIAARLAGHTVCLRGESPLNQELEKSGFNRFMKRILLQGFLFRFVNRFLYIGSQNKAFYEYYGVAPTKLLFAPYAVDNDRFREAKATLQKSQVRLQLGIPSDAWVVLQTAKFIEKKRPLDLVKAFAKLDIPNKFLVMVGDGELRQKIEELVIDYQLSGKVLLPGFVNQGEISKYYASADTFVLSSGVGETWGLSVNEAMNFDLPVVVSDTAGCADDLALDGVTGFRFKTGDVDALTSAVTRCHSLGSGLRPSEVVTQYSFDVIAKALISQ